MFVGFETDLLLIPFAPIPNRPKTFFLKTPLLKVPLIYFYVKKKRYILNEKMTIIIEGIF